MNADALVERIRKRAPNFRLLGEGVVAPGRLYRSSELSALDAQDWAAMAQAGIRTLIDLRGPAEIALMPVDPPPQITLVNIPFPAEKTRPFSGTADEHETAEWIAAGYRGIVARQGAGIGEVFKRLAQDDALPAVLYCTAGKDRTGIIAALLLLAIGAAPEMMERDYTRSNGVLVGAGGRQVQEAGARVAAFAMPEGGAAAAMLRADPAYLAAALEAAGPIDAFLARLRIAPAIMAGLSRALRWD